MQGFFKFHMFKFFIFFLFFLSSVSRADVINPVLAELTLFKDRSLSLDLHLSIEGAMTDMGTQFSNTQSSPNSDQYDRLRNLESEELKKEFMSFEPTLRDRIHLDINGKRVTLELTKSKVGNKGYTKRPRKSILTYEAQLDEHPEVVSWKYAEIYGDTAFRFRIFEEGKYNWSDWSWLRDGKSSGDINLNFPKPESLFDRVIKFTIIGFDHVIPMGWDHILFIVGMALSSLKWKKLLILVSSFTLAHTITLGMSMYEIVSLDERIVEPLIAFSISYIAIENFFRHSSSIRQVILVFGFGLLHGLGFATMLKQLEMSPEHFLSTLISFNVGVELAQALIVLIVVSISLFVHKQFNNHRGILVIPVSILIALIGLYWGLERIEFI